jgi:hypothetical protein
MTDEQIENYRKTLSELTAKCSDSNPESRIREDLKKLACQVGASTCVLYVANGHHMTGDADTSEIIRNIHQALQTASMVNMCQRATQSCEIATKTTKHARRQSGIALLTTVAAWVAAIAAVVAAMKA